MLTQNQGHTSRSWDSDCPSDCFLVKTCNAWLYITPKRDVLFPYTLCFTCLDEAEHVESRGGVTIVLEEDWESVDETSKPERRKISFFNPFHV